MTTTEAFTLAKQHHQAGDAGRAEPLYRAVVQADPANAHAWYLLGAACQSLGKLDDAAASLRQALRLAPGRAATHNHLGVTLAQQGKRDEAAASFREALRLQPDYAEADRNLRAVSLHLGTTLRQAKEAAAAHNARGEALAERGEAEAALACFRQALQIDPDLAEAHFNLGILLSRTGRAAEATARFREGLRLRPQFPGGCTNLGNTLLALGRVEEAAASYRQAVLLNPDDGQAHANLGLVLVGLGQAEEAVGCCRTALRLNPGYARVYHQLGELMRQNYGCLTEEEIAQVRKLLTEERLSPKDRSLLEFTLAYASSKDGKHDEAFTHFQRANEAGKQDLRQRGQVFNIEKHRAWMDRIAAAFTAERLRPVESPGLDTELPVFIVGMPRSGTTLVEQILSSHPKMFGAGELRDLQQLVDALPGRVPAGAFQLAPRVLRGLAERYVQHLAGMGGAAVRIIDKMPENYVFLGVVALLFPRARIIHCRRDARDVCISCFTQPFATLTFTSDLRDLGLYHREYEKLMAHWRAVLPAPMFEVSYEDLVERQEALSRELVAFCGLEWNDRCLAFHENPRAVKTASKLQVRQPIYGSSVGRWKKYEKHLQPLLEALGDRPKTEE